MGSNQVIACWGSPGSGTTLTAAKIALELANLKKNVILVLCDNETPMLPLLAPDIGEAKSLGDLLALPTISPIDIFQHCIPVKSTLSLMGYLREENENTWPDYTEERALKLIDLLNDFADYTVDYTVIDCTHHLLYNPLTAAALKTSDTTFRIMNADPKSLMYLKSQSLFLMQDPAFRFDKHVRIINNLETFQALDTYREAFGGKAYVLPHLEALQIQYGESRLLEPLTGWNSKAYQVMLQKMIAQEILSAEKQEYDARLNTRIPMRGGRQEELIHG